MKKNNKYAGILISLLGLGISTSLIVGFTYSFFSTSKKASNHLQIKDNITTGTLDASLIRVSGKKDVASSDGKSIESTTLDSEDFSKENNNNIFGLTESDYTIKGCKYIANMKLTNTGDINFSFDIKLTNTKDKENTESFEKELTVKYGNDESSLTDKGSLNEVITASSLDKGTLKEKEEYEFSVEIEFPTTASTTSGDVWFDLLVEISSLPSSSEK